MTCPVSYTHLDVYKRQVLHFLDGLRAKVPDVEQVVLRILNQLTNRVDTSALQAVVGTNGKVQILDLLVELSVGLLVFGSEDGNYFALFVFLYLVEHEECAHVLVDDIRSTAHSLSRVDGAISLNFKNKLVIVGALANAGVSNTCLLYTSRCV